MENKNIFEKLSEVQNELKAPKGQKNTFGNYRYRSCEDILEAVKPILQKHRLTLVISDEIVVIGDNNPTIINEKKYDKSNQEIRNDNRVSSTQRYYVQATATLYDMDNIEQWVENRACAREEEIKTGMDQSQITGTASSYARKYALNGLFNIDDTKDADTDEYTKKTEDKTINIKLHAEFQKLLIESETDLDDLLKYFKVSDSTKLSESQYNEAIAIMKKKSIKKEVF